MRLKGRPLKHCRSKLSTISFHRSVLRPTFHLQVIRYWNPFTRRDLQLRIFYGAVGSSSYVTRHGMLNEDNAGVLTHLTPYTIRKTRNFLEQSWWGWWQHCNTVTRFKYWPCYCLTRQGFRVFLQSKWIPAHYLGWYSGKEQPKTETNGVDTKKIRSTNQVSMQQR